MKNEHILIVEDSQPIQMLIKSTLNSMGYSNITKFDNGRDAYKFIVNKKVDLIICDWYMPYMTGIELLTKIRYTPGREDIPFIMLTIEGNQDKIIRAINLKVNDYIVKPFTQNHLQERVERILTNT